MNSLIPKRLWGFPWARENSYEAFIPSFFPFSVLEPAFFYIGISAARFRPVDDPDNIRRFQCVGTPSPANRIAIADAIPFNEGIGVKRKSARIQQLKERMANRLRTFPKVRFYSSPEPAESCSVATFAIEGIEMARLADHVPNTQGFVVSPIKHPHGLIIERGNPNRCEYIILGKGNGLLC